MGKAIFSNINDMLYGKTTQRYDRVVKRFRKELKRQEIIPTIHAGYIKNFVASKIITEQAIQKMFITGWELRDFEYAEITIFTWE